MKEFINKINPCFLFALSGLLLGLSVIFPEIGLLAYVALIPMAYGVYSGIESGRYNKIRRAYLDGFVFFMIYGLVIFHWFIYYYPLDFTGLSRAEAIGVVLLACIGVPTLQAVFSSALFSLAAVFIKSDIYKKRPVILPFFIAMLFSVNEWTQTLTWAGIPWGRIGISQTEMPILMQTASLFGSYFITFFVVLFNFLVAYALFYESERRRTSVMALALLGSYILCGTVLYFIPTKNEDKYIKIASVQGNLLSQTNYDMPINEIYDIYERLSLEAVEDGAQVVVWPENVFSTNFDAFLRIHGKKYVRIWQAMSELAVETGATFISGGYIYSEDGEEMYNSVSVFYPDGDSIIGAYSKMKPVPFGEFVPMRSFIEAVLPQLSEISMLSSDTTPGKDSTVFGTSNGADSITVGTLICFDSVYEQTALGSARAGAEFFFVPSNDSWFYDSRALNMHHAQNILRAVEHGKYTVSSGNTGITSFVSDKGDVIERMPIYEEGYIIETVYANSTRTLYSHIGNSFVYFCIGFVFVACAGSFIKRKEENE